MNKDDFKQVNYNPETGLFFSIANITKPIGTVNANGYVVFKVNGKLHYAHRVAFFLVNGFLPKMVDHINGKKTDNRIKNLRAADATINGHNRQPKGVTKHKGSHKWIASIMVNYKRKHIGYFDTPELAHQAYLEAKKIHHPTAPH